ncbi:hypothetical protein PINS_up007248 [Pythium insidiosum]|nr:hypothetical protein PINS_up007248 [Pythium insidiosum]
MVQLFVKTTAGKKFSVDIELERTVAECKTALVATTEVPEAQQRLIFKGKVLKDEETLASYGIAAEDTIYFVRGSAAPRTTRAAPAAAGQPSSVSTPASQPASTSTTSSAPTGAGATAPSPFSFPLIPPMGANANAAGNANPFGDLFGGMGGGIGGGMPNMNAMQQQMLQNPEMMRQMMDSPIVQSIMNNPEIMRSVMQSNPAIQRLMEQNPQLNHVLNDPELLRQSMEAMRNPAAMREMMRSQDTAMRNIESHPEGFNALRRMYQDVQEPLLDATSAGSRTGGGTFAMPGVPGASTASGSGQSAASGSTPPASATSSQANPWATAPGAGSQSPFANPWATPSASAGAGMGAFGGLGSGAGAPNPELLSQLLQSPLMQPMLDEMANNPQMFVSQMEQMNPQVAAMLNANPQMRQMMMNPDFIRGIMNPQNLQAMLQMQSAMNQLRSSGLIPGFEAMNLGGAGMPGAPGTTPAAGSGPPLDFSTLLGGLGAPGATGAAAPAANPEEQYASQLTQLNDMGFSNRDQNIRALQATFGNVHAAVERILNGSI